MSSFLSSWVTSPFLFAFDWLTAPLHFLSSIV